MSFLRSLPATRSPVWTLLGSLVLLGTLGATFLFSGRRVGPTAITHGQGGSVTPGAFGSLGTLTERMGESRFDLHYARIRGEERDLSLEEVRGRLTESQASWELDAPSARRAEQGIWAMDAPVAIRGLDLGGRVLGQGEILGEGEALRWEKGVWRGLAPLTWESTEGRGKGRWHLPAGWRRDSEGVLLVDHGPVVWEAAPGGSILRLESQRLSLGPAFLTGRMYEVRAQLTEGRLQAPMAEFTPDRVRWAAPLHFDHMEGWSGEADGGNAPRPAPGAGVERLEFMKFRGSRATPAGPERIQAEGARWTPAGFRLEGSVAWDQPLEGQRLKLQAPVVLMREGPGEDLPADLPVGIGRAEGHPVLSWGSRSLTGPRMEADRARRTWTIQGPVLGRAEEGTFQARSGSGNPSAWSFEGPVTLSLSKGGELRGLRLAWEGTTWTMTGRPATWSRLRERLSGHRIVRRGENILFPEGLSAALSTSEGDLSLQADRGERSEGSLLVEGHVDCQGRGWRLRADRLRAELGPGRTVLKVQAKGRVSLQGNLGEGRGDSLELEIAGRKVNWSGRVHGYAETQPW
ncbi:MAG: hypothetical protein HY823_09480 [Acidobacteria bacterium]|nr:hypothetical protein [Acidobacteriota bacterium]